MFLFLIASGLSLIFGVLRVLNFAHGSFYMLGAYLAWQIVSWIGAGARGVLAGGARRSLGGGAARRRRRAPAAASSLRPRGALPAPVHLCAGADPGRRGEGAVGHAAALGVATADAGGRVRALRRDHPATTTCSSCCWGRRSPACFWLVLHRTYVGRMVRAAALDREMLGALGRRCRQALHRHVRARLVPRRSGRRAGDADQEHLPGMDVEIIVEAFIVVVIGGLGSLWGTFLGALIFGQVLAFGILIFPRFSMFSAFALMAVILIVRPWGLLGRPLRQMTAMPQAHPLDADRVPRRGDGPAARLALLHLPRHRHRHPRPVRGQPEYSARLYRPRLVRPCRLFRDRRLCLRDH